MLTGATVKGLLSHLYSVVASLQESNAQFYCLEKDGIAVTVQDQIHNQLCRPLLIQVAL